MADKPAFLNQPGASSSSSGGGDRFPNRPQPSGTPSNGGPVPGFENRPQPSGPEKSGSNSESVPGGGKLPFPGPAKETPKPYKLGG